MKVRVHTRNTITYRGHFIRRVEDEFRNMIVLIDNPNNEIENAPTYMQENELPYASIADAKRAINGEEMVWTVSDAWEYRKEDYINRFKQK